MTGEEFCARVRKHLKRATDAEWGDIRSEIMGHIEDRAEDFERSGLDRAEAEARAAAAMGEPEEVGAALNRQLSLLWLVIQRASWVLTAVLCLALLMYANPVDALRLFRDSRTARTEPWNSGYGSAVLEQADYPLWERLDLRETIGNDVLWIYQVGLDPERGMATVATVCYDEKWMGVSSKLSDYVMLGPAGGESERRDGSGGGSREWYWRFEEIPVQPTDTALTLRCERYGEQLEVEIPLPWEVMP